MKKKRNPQECKRKVSSYGASSKQLRPGKNKGRGGTQIERLQEDDDVHAWWARERKRQKMELKLEDGKLFITLPRIVPPTLSRSGKTYLIATTGGVKRTPLLVDGAPLYVVATAFIYGDWVPPVKWVPLFELPKTEEQKEEEEDERESATIPLLE